MNYINCKVCGEELPHTSEYFHKNGDKLRTTCKKCRNKKAKKYSKEYYEKNYDKKQEYNSEYYLKHSEKLKRKANDRYDGVVDDIN